MKMRILTAVTMVVLIGAAAFGLVKRQTYTDLCSEENYLDRLYVAEAISPLTENSCSDLEQVLPGVPYILRVSPTGEFENLFATSRQKVQIEEVYAGNGLQKGDEIYLTSSQWRIVVELQPSALECSFVNIMKEGKEYLVFLTEKVRTDSEVLPVYRLYSNSMITPVFCYEDMENVIIPVGEGPTYVPYSQVKDNEFFSADEEGLEAWNSLKQKMLAAYPK